MAYFTDEQINEILGAVLNATGHTKYIGARYVPIFGRKDEESIIWDNTAPYEPLTVVLYQGNSYTSRQYVPTGIEITNNLYWAETGNYNAQVEQYRQEVLGYNNRMTAIETNADELEDYIGNVAADVATNATAISNETTARENADSEMADDIADVSQAVLDETTARTNADDALTNRINSQNVRIGDIETDIENIAENARPARPKKVVCIGDSYGRGVGGLTGGEFGWPYYLNQYLGCDYFLNISNSGAGFVKVSDASTSGPYHGQNFNGQLTIARDQVIADSASQDVNVYQIDAVIIAGGYNDHGQSGIFAGARTVAQTAKTLFPKSTIYVLPLAVPRGMDSEFHSCYTDICTGAASGGAAVFNQSAYWLLAKNYDNVMNSDKIHPTDEGYKIIARNMAACVCGGDYIAEGRLYGSGSDGFEVSSGVSVNGFRCGVNQGMAWMVGGFNVTSPTPNTTLATLPYYLRPIAGSRYFVAIGYWSGHAIPLRMRLGTDGHFDIQSAFDVDTSLLANVTTVYIAPFSMPLNVM